MAGRGERSEGPTGMAGPGGLLIRCQLCKLLDRVGGPACPAVAGRFSAGGRIPQGNRPR